MKALELFGRIEDEIPLEKAFNGDHNGYIGSLDPNTFDVKNVLVLMDYLPQKEHEITDYFKYDLLILHHPPIAQPTLPTYVIHSNWDIIQGGACDALADSLNIIPHDVLDDSSGIGRIGKISTGPVTLGRFISEVRVNLRIQDLRIVNCNKFRKIENICLVSGFGLQPDLIEKAVGKGVDVFLSGDLTHKGAITGKKFGITLIDATHYATEFPGLCRLGKFIASMGPDVKVRNDTLPWTRPS